MNVDINAEYKGRLDVVCEHLPSGNILHTTAPLDNGGRGDQFSPTDLLVSAVGCCALTIMSQRAQENGFDIVGTKVRVTKEMSSDPRRVGGLIVKFTFPFRPSDQQMIILEEAFKNCPVRNSLRSDILFKVCFNFPEI